MGDYSRRVHARLLTDRFQQAICDRDAGFRIALPWDRELTGQNLIGLEARRNGHDFLQAQSEQRSAGQKNNAEAMEDLIKNQGVTARPLPDAVVDALREANTKILAEAVAKDPVTKKVNDSYMAYLAKFKEWSAWRCSQALIMARLVVLSPATDSYV